MVMISVRYPRAISRLLLVLVPLAGAAQLEDSPPLRIDVAYASKYVFRGVARAGDSMQATVEIAREHFHAGFFGSRSLREHGADESNLNAGYVWQTSSGISVEAMLTHAWFTNVPGGGVERAFEAGLAATLTPLAGFTPRLACYHDFRFRAETAELSLARSIALTKLGAFLELNLFAGWVRGRDWRPAESGPDRCDDYGYWGGEVSLPYRIGAHTTIVGALHFANTGGRSAASGPFGRSRDPNWWANVGVSLDF